MIRVILPVEMKKLEEEWMAGSGEDAACLMARAAEGLVFCAGRLLAPRKMESARIAVFCGPGANGGDGWAAARRLQELGAEVTVIAIGQPIAGSAAEVYYHQCLRSSIRVVNPDPDGTGGPTDTDGLLELLPRGGFDLCVDALFGTGLNRPLSGIWLLLTETMKRLRNSGAHILAADIPSGLNGADGSGDACRADLTVTFAHVKRGQLFGHGQDLCGELVVWPIGISGEAETPDMPVYEGFGRVALPDRKHDSHKGTWGHLLLLAGSADYPGAAILSLRAATRSGAGLVSALCPAEIRSMLQLSVPCAITVPAPDRDYLGPASVSAVIEAMKGKSAFAVGPGVSRNLAPGILKVLLDSGLPGVLDADALNILARDRVLLARLNRRHVLTPHPGEMARLTGGEEGTPERLASDMARKYGCTVLLKGCATCIAGSEGPCHVVTPGTPGLACGGSGDVLTGLIGGLLAQGIPPEEAALFGASLHGAAGRVAEERYGTASMNADDLPDSIPEAFRRLTNTVIPAKMTVKYCRTRGTGDTNDV